LTWFDGAEFHCFRSDYLLWYNLGKGEKEKTESNMATEKTVTIPDIELTVEF
jgi:hypothetical protein